MIKNKNKLRSIKICNLLTIIEVHYVKHFLIIYYCLNFLKVKRDKTCNSKNKNKNKIN